MKCATVKDIVDLTGLNQNTIRKYADEGIIESKRDFRGWRVFPNHMETVKRIEGLLNGDIHLEQS